MPRSRLAATLYPFISCTVLALTTLSAARAQTATDDQPSTEAWWDRVGAGFFSDPGLTQLRGEFDIRAHWTALSPEDQAEMRRRCASLEEDAGAATAPLPAPGGGGTTVTGQSGGESVQRPAPRPFTPADLTAESGRIAPVCAIVAGL